MIVVRLYGGLGNQMFQYALGRKLALDRSVALELDLAWFATNPKRNYALGHFRIAAGPASSKPGTVVQECSFAYDPSVLNCPANAYLDGYWQSERYFSNCADVIRADFQLRQPIFPQRRKLAEQILGARAPVSVHVRRGDYASDPTTLAYHGLCAPEWYGRAMDRMAEGLDAPTYFVFSDDPDWARANLPLRREMVFVEQQPDGRDFEDMHLMASCHHHIVANSSFSWWGAWLNPNPAKRVIAPARWFDQGPSNTTDLIPTTWIQL